MHLRTLPALALLALAAALPAPALAADLLPDLDQEQPDAVEVTVDHSGASERFHLGFDSSTDNAGAGPLTIDAHRSSTDEPQMVADQTIEQSDGGTRTVPAVGHLQYTYSADHQHWHYLGFVHYELRSAYDYSLVAPDQKTGFCLGDRYNTHLDQTLPGEPPDRVYYSFCGKGRTDLLELREGISVGWGDFYEATLEGQFVDLTGVPAGEYYLVQRANADHKLLESDYSNNESTLRLELSWPKGMTEAPSVKIVDGCPIGDTCPGPLQQPPGLTRAAAARYARAALRRSLGFAPRGFAVSCARKLTPTSRACGLAGSHAGTRYSIGETITYKRTRTARLSYGYTLSGRVRDGTCGCIRQLPPSSGRVRIGKVARAAGSAVSQPGQRLVALDDPALDGVRLGPVVHQVPRFVRHPLGGLRTRLPAQ
jgi:hypothetical protein